MTISTLSPGSAPLALGPPTAVLPPIKSIALLTPNDFALYLGYLRIIYVPEVRGSRRLQPKPKTPRTQISTHDVYREDHFERTHALRWLTSSISRFPADDNTANDLLQSAASLLAICAGASAAGVVTRRFTFGPLHIDLVDAALENADFGSVGAQTWGAACVLADLLAEDPAAFLPLDARSRAIRVLELGAGTGLVSLTLGKLAEHLKLPLDVVATDNHPLVLDNLRANVDANLGPSSPTVRVARLDWTEVYTAAKAGNSSSLPLDAALTATFDVIFGADIVYAPEHARWLHACAAHFLRPDGQFHLVVALRDSHSREAASIEEIFSSSADSNAPCITRKESIVCEGSPKGPGRPAEEIEYWHFVLEWPQGGPRS
ncbi:hypothetical protein PENSPDRAFT_649532 [Peniophora sp. CONT]|nr:hypothetical protein PENSPDRAFT_649532 [Peniophora sp. CONT]